MRIGLLIGLCFALACGGSGNSGGSGGSGAGSPDAGSGSGTSDGGTADAGRSDGGAADGGAAGGVGVTSDAGVPASLAAIELSQTDVHIPVGVMTSFAVTGTYLDGSRGDVTPAAQATSSNYAVATVARGEGAQIQISGVASGRSTVTVSVGQLQKTCSVTITPR